MLKRIVTLGAIAPLMFALGACSADDGGGSSTTPASTQTQNNQAQAAFDGATIMRGVYFGMGPAATMLPEIWANGQADQIRNRIMAMAPGELADQLDRAANQLREEGQSAVADHTSQIAAALRSGAITPSQLDKPTTDASRIAKAESTIARIAAEDPTFFPRFLVAMRSGNPARVESALRSGAAKIASFAGTVEPKTNIADQRGTVGWWWGPGDVAVDAELVAGVAFIIVIAVVVPFDPAPSAKDRFGHEAVVEMLASRFACADGCGSNSQTLKQ